MYFQRTEDTGWDMILVRLLRCPAASRRGWLCSSSGLSAASQRHHFNIGGGVGGVDRIQGEDLTGTKVNTIDFSPSLLEIDLFSKSLLFVVNSPSSHIHFYHFSAIQYRILLVLNL